MVRDSERPGVRSDHDFNVPPLLIIPPPVSLMIVAFSSASLVSSTESCKGHGWSLCGNFTVQSLTDV